MSAPPEEVAALERVAARAWPAPVCTRLGDWLLRAAEGFTGRANSALPLGDPGTTVDEALDQVECFYRAAGLPPTVDVPMPLPNGEAIRAAATARGWTGHGTVYVQTAAVRDIVTAAAAAVDVPLHDRPSVDHLAQIRDARGALPPAALRVLTGAEPVVFAEHRGPDGALLARARGSVTEDWLGAFMVATAPAARGRGLASSVMATLARWAAAQGATRAFLQVESDNTAAISLYRRLGFTTHHVYQRYAAPTV